MNNIQDTLPVVIVLDVVDVVGMEVRTKFFARINWNLMSLLKTETSTSTVNISVNLYTILEIFDNFK